MLWVLWWWGYHLVVTSRLVSLSRFFLWVAWASFRFRLVVIVLGCFGVGVLGRFCSVSSVGCGVGVLGRFRCRCWCLRSVVVLVSSVGGLVVVFVVSSVRVLGRGLGPRSGSGSASMD